MNKVHSEKIGKYTINIFQDDGAGNPFENWDGEPPIAVYSDRTITEYATKYGNVDAVPELTRAQIKANLNEILTVLELKSVFALRGGNTHTSVEDLVNDWLREYVDNEYQSKRLELLETLYTWAGVPALLQTVRGYCQGDWAEVLAVATPKFQNACGNTEGFWDNPDALAPSIELFGDWCFGNVYGYRVENEKGQTVDNCWGFFGDYDAEYGALSEAREFTLERIESDKRERVRQLKLWIKNRVPLYVRHFEG
jgi:hypothetical protein